MSSVLLSLKSLVSSECFSKLEILSRDEKSVDFLLEEALFDFSVERDIILVKECKLNYFNTSIKEIVVANFYLLEIFVSVVMSKDLLDRVMSRVEEEILSTKEFLRKSDNFIEATSVYIFESIKHKYRISFNRSELSSFEDERVSLEVNEYLNLFKFSCDEQRVDLHKNCVQKIKEYQRLAIEDCFDEV